MDSKCRGSVGRVWYHLEVNTRTLKRYLVAIAAILFTTGARRLLDPGLGDQVAFGLYLVVSILVAWVAGLGPGFITLVVGWWCGNFFFSSPRYSWYPHLETLPRIVTAVVYLCGGVPGVYFSGKAREAKERARTESLDKAHLEAGHLAAIVRSSDDAIITKNLDSIVTSWNAGAERIFGYSASETIGKPVTMLMPPDRTDEEPDILSRIKRGEVVDHYETVRRRKDGALIHISLTVSPLRDSQGRVFGASKIVRDITLSKNTEAALRESERQAREALAQAEAASRAKDEFLAVLSHELRTPMTAVLGWARMLKDGMGPEDTKQGIEVIERNARLQSLIIEDLLDMSRIVSGKFRLEVQAVDLARVLLAAVDSIRVAAEAKDVKLTVSCDPGGTEVRGDPNRLQQVFFNLLSNATKFTPRGGAITVWCGRVNSQIKVSVQDTGRGITPEFLPHVFERFQQQDAKTTRQHQGLGLGLAIVKHLVELHGGTVHAFSEGEGRGATFAVQLPAPALLHWDPEGGVGRASASDEEARAAIHERSKGVAQDLDGLTVMVTDDEPDTRELLKKLLERHGARVLVCGSAADALDRLQRHRPNVLLCDIGMPEVDGYGLISRVRSSSPDKGGATPAIALTAFARSEDRTRSLLAGFQLHLAKPVEPTELIASIRSLAPTG